MSFRRLLLFSTLTLVVLGEVSTAIAATPYTPSAYLQKKGKTKAKQKKARRKVSDLNKEERAKLIDIMEKRLNIIYFFVHKDLKKVLEKQKKADLKNVKSSDREALVAIYDGLFEKLSGFMDFEMQILGLQTVIFMLHKGMTPYMRKVEQAAVEVLKDNRYRPMSVINVISGVANKLSASFDEFEVNEYIERLIVVLDFHKAFDHKLCLTGYRKLGVRGKNKCKDQVTIYINLFLERAKKAGRNALRDKKLDREAQEAARYIENFYNVELPKMITEAFIARKTVEINSLTRQAEILLNLK